MIIYIQNQTEYIKKVLELVSDISRVSEYKINIQKFTIFTINKCNSTSNK